MMTVDDLPALPWVGPCAVCGFTVNQHEESLLYGRVSWTNADPPQCVHARCVPDGTLFATKPASKL